MMTTTMGTEIVDIRVELAVSLIVSIVDVVIVEFVTNRQSELLHTDSMDSIRPSSLIVGKTLLHSFKNATISSPV